MKFLNIILSLIIVSTVSCSVPLNHLKTREDKELNPFSSDCNIKLQKYEDCYSYDIRGNSDSIDCEIFNSATCKELYKSKISGIPECQKDDKTLLEYMDNVLELFIVSAKFECSKNEYGEYCPIAQLEKDNTVTNKDYLKKYEQAVSETCKSRKCIDSFMDFYLQLKEVDEKSKNYFGDIESTSFASMININKKKLISKIFRSSNIVKREFKSNIKNKDVENIDTYLGLLKETSVYLDSQECFDQMPSIGFSTISYSIKHTLLISTLLLYIITLI